MSVSRFLPGETSPYREQDLTATLLHGSETVRAATCGTKALQLLLQCYGAFSSGVSRLATWLLVCCRICKGGVHSRQKHSRWDRRHPAHQNNPGTAQNTSLASVVSRKLFRSRCCFFWRFDGFVRKMAPNLAIFSWNRQNVQ
jgi:hypothetical protein